MSLYRTDLNSNLQKTFGHLANLNFSENTDFRFSKQNQVLQKGLPSRKSEDWKYFNLKAIFETEFKESLALSEAEILNAITNANLPIIGDAVLLIVNSQLYQYENAKLGKASFVKEENSFVKDFSESKHASNFLADTQYSLLSSIYTVKLDKSFQNKMLQVIYINESAKNIQSVKLNIVVESNTSVKLYEHFVGKAEASLQYCRTDILLQANAHLNYTRVNTSLENAFFMNDLYINQEADTNCKIVQYSAGAQQARSNIWIDLSAENATADAQCLYLAHKRQQVDHNIRLVHKAGNTFSTQNFKGIIDDYAKAIFDGKIQIDVGADGSNAEQSNKNMLLSSKAEVDSRPQLIVKADDVKAAHGHSTGKINPDELFYLMSRAIEPSKAKEILSQAYAHDILLRCENAELKKYLLNSFSEWIGQSRERI